MKEKMIKFELNGARAKQAFCVNGKFYNLNSGVLPESAFQYAEKKYGIKSLEKEVKNGK